MEICIFTPSRPYVENDNNFDNQIPDANRRRGNPFWGFVGNMLGLEPDRYPPPNELDWQLDAVARRDERMRALNLPPTRGEVVAGIVGDVVEAVKQVVRKLTKKQQAIAWLRQVTEQGPVPQTELVRAGSELGLSLKVLKSAKQKAGVISTRKGFPYWVWRRSVEKVKGDQKS
jgi:hypothetical protein